MSVILYINSISNHILLSKDFDVGKTYKKTVKLTNVSYTVNYIKFVDITDLLKDFIKIQ